MDASAEERDISSVFDLDHLAVAATAVSANWMFALPVSTPTARTRSRPRSREALERLVRERHLRGDRHRVARVDTHRVEFLIEQTITTLSLRSRMTSKLELVPADQRFFDEHLADRALVQSSIEQLDELVLGVGRPAAAAAEGERRPEHDGEGPLRRDVVPARHDEEAKRSR